MKIKSIIIIALAICIETRCTQQQSTHTDKAGIDAPAVNVDQEKLLSVYYDDNLMLEAKAAVKAGDPQMMSTFNAIKQYVDANFLNMTPINIVDGKRATAPSRDPRDYISQSPYWWPDPENPGGPYIRFDGRTNPEVNNYPECQLGYEIGPATQSLAMMYFLTDDEKYAAKAAELIRAWYLDPKTGMNPNMTYSQYVPGMERIRGTGIIDAKRFIIGGLNAAQIISSSESWTDSDQAQLKDWAKAFAYWIENSVNGRAEARSGNNHGMWYETTLHTVLFYAGEYEHMRDRIISDFLPRIPRQTTADSVMPHELARTMSLHYTTYAIEPISQTAILADKIGLKGIWSHTGENGHNISMAIDYTIPYWLEPEKWPFEQIQPFNNRRAAFILYQAGKDLGNERYSALADQIGYTGYDDYEGYLDMYSILHYKMKK